LLYEYAYKLGVSYKVCIKRLYNVFKYGTLMENINA